MNRRAGFTLIELMAVLAILAILGAVLVTQIGSARESVEVQLTRTRLQEIRLAASDYEVDQGDYPRSRMTKEQGSPPNALNIGVECLVLALWSDGREGSGLRADELDNTDGDRSAKSLSDLPVRDLFELVDPWGNPIAYFHHADYGREDVYSTFDPDTGELLESTARALRNSKLGRYYEHRRFQLLSAGPDGRFGTEDDLASFSLR